MNLIEVIGANMTSIVLSQVNAVLGIVSLTTTIGFTIFKFYQEYKTKK